MAPLPSAVSLSADESAALRELTRAPLLSGPDETRAAVEIEAARRSLFDELLRCPDAAAELSRQTGRPPADLPAVDPRTLDLAAAASRIDDEFARARTGALLRAFGRAVDRLALHNTRLAVSIARRYVGRGLPLPDLVQEAMLGLLKAARRFEYRRGLKFCTSATWWIRQAVVLAIQERGRLVRLPARALESLTRMRRARAALGETLGRDPSIGELAGGSGLSPRKALTLAAHLGSPRSLEAPELADGLRQPDPEDVEGLDVDLSRAMEALSRREREILNRRYGLEGLEPDTLDRVGRRLGLSRERIRQIERTAMEKLRRHLGRMGYAVQPRRAAPAP